MQKKIIIYFVICTCLFSSFFVYAQTDVNTDNVNDMIVMKQAKLRILNKQLGRVDTTILDVGDSYKLDNLKITVYVCYKNKEYDTPENTMFLQVQYTDAQTDDIDDGVTIFSGWMFSSSPSLSAMEHPVYDIWLLSCEK